MKILQMISSSGLYGAENVLLNLASLLKENGDSPYLLCLKNISKPNPAICFEAAKKDIPSRVIPCKNRLDIHALCEIKSFIRKEKIEIIHTHGYKGNFYGLISSKLTRTPIVATIHGWTGEDKKVRFYEKLDKWAIRKMSHLVCVSPAIAEYLKMLGLKVSLIPNAIDTERFSPANGKCELRDKFNLTNELVIGSVGRLNQEKGHLYLIEAFKEIHSELQNVKLLIVGEGPLREKLEKKVEELGLKEDVIFTGVQEDMPSVYKCMDVFVLPSLKEGLPLVLLEAMSMGLPAVVSRVGGIPYVLNHDEGTLIAPGDITELKNAIISLLQNSSLRRSLGEKARQKALTQFSLPSFYEKYRKVYEGIVGKD